MDRLVALLPTAHCPSPIAHCLPPIEVVVSLNHIADRDGVLKETHQFS